MRSFGMGLFLVSGLMSFAGCSSSKPEPSQSVGATAVGNPADAMPSDNSAVKGVVKNGLYVTAAGKPLCPVKGDVIEDGKGVGHTTYKGVEYRFCCPGCPEEFKANPAKYAIK